MFLTLRVPPQLLRLHDLRPVLQPQRGSPTFERDRRRWACFRNMSELIILSVIVRTRVGASYLLPVIPRYRYLPVTVIARYLLTRYLPGTVIPVTVIARYRYRRYRYLPLSFSPRSGYFQR